VLTSGIVKPASLKPAHHQAVKRTINRHMTAHQTPHPACGHVVTSQSFWQQRGTAEHVVGRLNSKTKKRLSIV